jgi:uncharacterized membrane protein
MRGLDRARRVVCTISLLNRSSAPVSRWLSAQSVKKNGEHHPVEVSDVALARALHVLGVVLWIGGVGLITTVLLPSTRELTAPQERVPFFERLEGRFAAQARFTTLLVGLSGLYLVWRWDLWARFTNPRFWWMHAMVVVWLVFTVMLFVLEPFILHRWFRERAKRDPDGTFRLIERLHWGLFGISLVTVAAAVAGSHGGL